MIMIKMFYDTETTGTNYKKHSIHSLAGFIDVDNEIVETFDFRIGPHPKTQFDPVALRIGGVTEDDLILYPPMPLVFKELSFMLNKYVDRYNPNEKIKLVGFNNRAFDDDFFRMLFDLCGSSFFGAYFWPDTADVLVLASHYLEDRRHTMPSFKLKRVALELGIDVKAGELHGALYDVALTRQIYRIVTGIDLEI